MVISEMDSGLVTNKIINITQKNQEKLIEIRRYLHQHPELGFSEFETRKYIKNILIDLGLDVTEIAKTGLVGILKGGENGKTVAIRADMDALPIYELNDVEYKSLYDGRMHACGHDVHMALAIGTAIVLSEIKDYIKGNIKFIFQPAEETTGGAKLMINEGVLDNPKVDYIIGGHVWPSIPAGKIGMKSGPIMGSSDFIEIKVIGKGGHAAKPHNTIDPIIIGCEIINAFQKIISRQIDPAEQVVISMCKFESGSGFNIIPNETVIKGTVRTLNEKIRESMPKKMEDIIEGIVKPYGANYEFKYIKNYPVTNNHENITDYIKKSVEKIMGKENVVNIEKASLTGEDFSYFLREIPGTFIWVGVKNEKNGIVYDLHHPQFDIDEYALSSGVKVYSQAIMDLLHNN